MLREQRDEQVDGGSLGPDDDQMSRPLVPPRLEQPGESALGTGPGGAHLPVLLLHVGVVGCERAELDGSGERAGTRGVTVGGGRHRHILPGGG